MDSADSWSCLFCDGEGCCFEIVAVVVVVVDLKRLSSQQM